MALEETSRLLLADIFQLIVSSGRPAY